MHILGESVHYVNPYTFTALSLNGATLIYAYQECVAIAMPDGTCYVRMKKASGDRGRTIETQLQVLAAVKEWNGAMSVTECSEKEFAEVERTLAEAPPLPPAVMRMAEDGSAQPIKR